ncbi:MAG: class I SAM-dependent methyltransferase [Gemmataceae bacterium]|nr:class I SAM-dependent methyltransferase [Gemmataceae bacterium]
MTAIEDAVRGYYTRRLAEHGPTPRGVDWNGAESQEVRFRQLLRLVDGPYVLGDYGCGYGALLGYARAAGFVGEYRGYDLAPAMIAAARDRYAADPRAAFGDREDVLAGCDVVVASGVFNVKLDAPVGEWDGYVFRTLDRLAELGPRGFAFNALTSYSDPDRMRPDLYYADPCRLFDRCKRRYSRQVALLHDYGLYEFTILVRK